MFDSRQGVISPKITIQSPLFVGGVSRQSSCLTVNHFSFPPFEKKN